MASTLVLNTPLVITLADAKMVLLTMPVGAKWLRIYPRVSAAQLQFSGADAGTITATNQETYNADTATPRFIGGYGAVLISGTAAALIEITASSGSA